MFKETAPMLFNKSINLILQNSINDMSTVQKVPSLATRHSDKFQVAIDPACPLFSPPHIKDGNASYFCLCQVKLSERGNEDRTVH